MPLLHSISWLSTDYAQGLLWIVYISQHSCYSCSFEILLSQQESVQCILYVVATASFQCGLQGSLQRGCKRAYSADCKADHK